MPARGSQQGPRVGDQGDAGEGHVCGRHHKGKMESTSCRVHGACNHTQVIGTACVCVCVCVCRMYICVVYVCVRELGVLLVFGLLENSTRDTVCEVDPGVSSTVFCTSLTYILKKYIYIKYIDIYHTHTSLSSTGSALLSPYPTFHNDL